MRTTYLAMATLAAALCLSGTTHAQISCGPVSDEARVLRGGFDYNHLLDQGADVHIVTLQSLSTYGSRLIDAEKAYERGCSNWLAPNGQRKANLMVLMVAPNDKLKNIFLGSSYNGMFSGEDEVNLLYSKAANSFFRSGDWSGGLNATLRDLNKKVLDFHDQQKHPVQSGASHAFIVVMLVLFGLVSGGLLLWWLVSSLHKKQMEKRRIEASQQKAIRARNDATETFLAMPKDNYSYASFSSKYAALSGSMQSDPTTDGLTAESYDAIADDWRRLDEGIARAVGVKAGSVPSTPVKFGSSTSPSNRARKKEDWHNSHKKAPTTPEAPTPTSTTTVINNQSGSGDLATGIVLGEMLSDRPRGSDYRREPEYRREETRSSSSGSDSSWGSSSSDDSSSSFDSGSSGSDSSFGDSGSSDSGSSGSDSGW